MSESFYTIFSCGDDVSDLRIIYFAPLMTIFLLYGPVKRFYPWLELKGISSIFCI